MAEKKIQQEIRVVLGLSQKGFCEEYNISQATVSGWVNNVRVISPDHVKLLKSLGIPEEAIRKPWGVA